MPDMIHLFQSLDFVIPFLILIFSIIAHEVAHGVAAYIHGDTTAYDAGRLTLNPLPHIDPFGSVILPAVSLFSAGYAVGYAKPVPYDPRRLEGKYAESWVASAGVLTNFLLASIGVFIAHVLTLLSISFSQTIADTLFLLVWTNISLGIFNLIPIPPFDGMSIVQSLFPRFRHLTARFSYHPMYMVVTIVVATTIFGAISPYIATFVAWVL